MTYVPRSHYELGDPLLADLADEEATDHFRTPARGRRLLRLADHVVSVLDGLALITDPATVRAEVFHEPEA